MKYALILLAASLVFANHCLAQHTTEEFRYFSSEWKPAREKNATYLLRIRQTGDSSWQYSYYNTDGPLDRVEIYLDQKGTMRHGLFAWYSATGILDSCGYFDHGVRDESWFWVGEGMKVKRSSYYDKGRLLTEKQAWARLERESIPDPNYPDRSRETPESYFPGGAAGWSKYLSENLQYPKRAVKRLKEGVVVLMFKVEPTGAVNDIVVFRSVEMSLDDEAIRIITNSPSWVPAIKFEYRVPSYKIQPVGFRLQGR